MGASFVVLISAILLGAGRADGFVVYTLADDVVFEVTMPANSAIVKGIFHAVPPEVFETWDLATSGQDANASTGTHACADLGFNPSASCPFRREFDQDDQADGLAFGLSLDGDSGPVSGTGPDFSQPVDDAFGGAAYIVSGDPAERVPNSSTGGFFFFQDFVDGDDPQFFVQPGESTVWLISRYEPGEIAAAVLGGTTLRMSVADNRLPINIADTTEVALVALPEPKGSLFALVALLALRFFRTRRPRGRIGVVDPGAAN